MQFLAMDVVNGNDASFDPELASQLGEFIQLPNYLKLLEKDSEYDRTSLREALKAALSDGQTRASIKEKFMEDLVETYASTCIPLVAMGQGFSHVNKEKITPLLKVFEVDPKGPVEQVTTQIQGKPFSRKAFVELLKRSTAEDAAVAKKLEWLTEWCEHGINKVKSTQATDDQMKAMLRCITGYEEVSDKVRFRFDYPVEGYSAFKTCFQSVHFGRPLLKQTDKQKFIEMWNSHVDIALKQGFGLA